MDNEFIERYECEQCGTSFIAEAGRDEPILCEVCKQETE